MENIFGGFVNTVFMILGAVIAAGILIKYIKNLNASEKSVLATVVDKQSFTDGAVKKYPPYAVQRYIISFDTADGRRSFNVSADTFSSCCMHETGTLKYKGTRLISFACSNDDAGGH